MAGVFVSDGRDGAGVGERERPSHACGGALMVQQEGTLNGAGSSVCFTGMVGRWNPHTEVVRESEGVRRRQGR